MPPNVPQQPDCAKLTQSGIVVKLRMCQFVIYIVEFWSVAQSLTNPLRVREAKSVSALIGGFNDPTDIKSNV